MSDLIIRSVRIDLYKKNIQHGIFMRVVVELELLNHLCSEIILDGCFYKIDYEGFPSICFNCGQIRHSSIYCPHHN